MPQKRNPDVAELARGKAGRVVGDLVSLLTILKSLPLAYNRDLQEDKAPVFDAADRVLATLDALSIAVSALEFDESRLLTAASDPRLLAADLAEYLVARGVPFREAHDAVSAYLAKSDGTVDAASVRQFDPRFGEDVAELARGKTGRILGDLVSLLTTLKSLPLGYQRDLQEDKAPVFDAVDHVLATLDALSTGISALEFDAGRLLAAASRIHFSSGRITV